MGQGPKNQENQQFARTAGADGNRTFPGDGPNRGIEPLADDQGRLIVRVFSGGTIGGLTVQYKTATLSENAQIVSANSYLQLLFGFNNINSLIYFQLFNTAAAPIAGTVPDISILVPPFSDFSLGPNSPGWHFPLGIFYGSSSTPDTYTPIGLNNLWVNAQFNG